MAVKRKKKKDTSFATWKFQLENTVNADPLADGACLKVLRAYLDFMGEPNDRPFMSITNLKVATAMHEGAIVRARKKLVDLRYFIPCGHTSAGAVRYQIMNNRLNIVLDHQTVARETYKEIDAEKKAKERDKRKSSAPGHAEIAGDIGSAKIAGTTAFQVCDNRRDSTAEIADESVENTVEVISIEGEGDLIWHSDESGNAYKRVRDGDDPNDPLPIPDEESSAHYMISALCDGVDVHPIVQRRMMTMLKLGVLTRNLALSMIGKRVEDAA